MTKKETLKLFEERKVRTVWDLSLIHISILCCVICCACWGSWANTQKMVAAKQWSFELFYWDLTVGLFRCV